MTRDELVKAVAKDCDSSLETAEKFLGSFFHITRQRLIDGDEIKFPGIGVIYTKNFRIGVRKLAVRGHGKFNDELTDKYPIEDDDERDRYLCTCGLDCKNKFGLEQHLAGRKCPNKGVK